MILINLYRKQKDIRVKPFSTIYLDAEGSVQMVYVCINKAGKVLTSKLITIDADKPFAELNRVYLATEFNFTHTYAPLRDTPENREIQRKMKGYFTQPAVNGWLCTNSFNNEELYYRYQNFIKDTIEDFGERCDDSSSSISFS